MYVDRDVQGSFVHGVCSVCGYRGNVRIGVGDSCISCGFEHRVTDDAFFINWEAYRVEWVRRGMPWHGTYSDRNAPADWNPVAQLRNAIVTSPRQFAPPNYPSNTLRVQLAVTPTLRTRPSTLMAFVEDVLALCRPYGVNLLSTG